MFLKQENTEMDDLERKQNLSFKGKIPKRKFSFNFLITYQLFPNRRSNKG